MLGKRLIRSHLPPIILDIEASGFGQHSYPIEIGIAINPNERHCWLVHPHPDWTHWDESAQQVHGIDRNLLFSEGLPVTDVCVLLNSILRGRTIYSDGWVVDHPWLIKLFQFANMSMSFHHSPLEMILTESQMAIWDETKRALINRHGASRHRASIDAQLIQQTYILTEQHLEHTITSEANKSGQLRFLT
ncbi:hypothetical protein QX776_05770 [Alteromonadaceae bacterium BrNp21-10]|nr:hypothetical protein [Alteromonadaceae bacterium BrNp21-10]